MSNTYEKVCRLCLKIIGNNGFNTIEDVTMQMFDAILLKVELNKNKENVMCSECAATLQKSFNFKLTCISLKNKELISTKNNLKLNSAKACSIKNMNDALDERKSCRFCTKLIEADSSIYLNETKQNIPIVDMLQQHMPELELSISEELVSCEDCFKSLQHCLRFTTACSYAKEQVKEYGITEVTDDKTKITLASPMSLTIVSDIGSNAVNVYKTEEMSVKIEEDFTIKTEVKDENMETDNVDVSKDDEQTGTKSEHSDNESDQSTTVSHTHTETLRKCSRCPFITENISELRSHLVTHQSVLELTVYKCNCCSFETEGRNLFEEHTLMHKTASVATEFKSDPCAFETKLKTATERRNGKHKRGSQTKLHVCPICPRELTNKRNFRKHMLLHENPSDTTMFVCEICGYESKYKSHVKKHMITHASPSETVTYEYEYCPFKSQYKNVVIAHALKNKKPTKTKWAILLQDIGIPEVTSFKCNTCEFETEHRDALKVHVLRDKDGSRTKIYTCPVCSRKYKHSVTGHASRITKQKCELCPYETIFTGCIKQHMRIHATWEKPKYRCGYCRVESKYEYYMNLHMQIHGAVLNRDTQVPPNRQKYASKTY